MNRKYVFLVAVLVILLGGDLSQHWMALNSLVNAQTADVETHDSGLLHDAKAKHVYEIFDRDRSETIGTLISTIPVAVGHYLTVSKKVWRVEMVTHEGEHQGFSDKLPIHRVNGTKLTVTYFRNDIPK